MVRPPVVLALFLAVAAACVPPDVPARSDPRDLAPATAASRLAAEDLLRTTGAPGLAFAVARHGQLICEQAVGVVDLDSRLPVATQTKFAIGSITKSMTMALVGALVDEGKLGFDDPIERWLPDFPHAGRGITLRRIAGHLSGYADQVGSELYLTTQRFSTTREVLQRIYAEPLAAAPGERHQYATATYMLIAGAIEAVTGDSYLAAMQQRLLMPLGLTATVPNDNRQHIPERTTFHRRDGDKVARAPETDPSHKWAGAGYLATARDVAMFGCAMLDDRYLQAATRQALFTTLKASDGTDTGFGLGFRSTIGHNGVRTIAQPGGGPGFAALLALYPADGLVVAILVNLAGVDVSPLRRVLVQQFGEP
ncbi:MAG: beta-lactamase family protein [Planctomycetes bacterium]|nr:beta-lactamase family protein [Planctomycetota bacterium]